MILTNRFHETGERIKMKLFNKALVATAVIGAFSAQAVTVSSDEILISQQGTASGIPAIIAEDVGDDFVLDFVVDALTPSASTITLTFTGGVDLSNINVASESIDNNIGVGQGEVNLATGTGNATFGYGTGSFTFDKFKVNTPSDADHSIEFKVNLGNPLTASSAFRLTLDTITNGIDLGSNTAEVCYSSVDASGTAIENDCQQITSVVSQFSFDVTQEFDGKIERVDQLQFARNNTGSDKDRDLLKFTLQNNEGLVAALPNANANVTISGAFTGMADAEFTDANGSFFGSTNSGITPVVNGGADAITFVVDNATLATEGANSTVAKGGEFSFNAASTSSVIPVTGDITFKVEYTDGTAANTFEYTDAAGSWSLDATVINVPYLPLGYDTTDASVHIANDGSVTANVVATIVTYCNAFNENVTCTDQMRSESVELGDVPANTVAKLSKGVLADAFGITEPTKVSITFNINSDAEDISAYATVTNDDGRSEISNSQTKVDGKGL
jgi:hypothetical protein